MNKKSILLSCILLGSSCAYAGFSSDESRGNYLSDEWARSSSEEFYPYSQEKIDKPCEIVQATEEDVQYFKERTSVAHDFDLVREKDNTESEKLTGPYTWNARNICIFFTIVTAAKLLKFF